MAEISIEFVGKQLQSIQAELREMKFAAEVERRNGRVTFDGLVAEVGVKLATFEAKIDHRFEVMQEQIDQRFNVMQQRIDQRLDRIEQLLVAKGSP